MAGDDHVAHLVLQFRSVQIVAEKCFQLVVFDLPLGNIVQTKQLDKLLYLNEKVQRLTAVDEAADFVGRRNAQFLAEGHRPSIYVVRN